MTKKTADRCGNEKTGPELYNQAKSLIPGGTQLLSKRPEMFLPDLWPSYYSRAKGDEIWDIQGNKYLDMSYSGLGACILGYADDDVNEAVTEAVRNASATTLNCPEEVRLAEVLVNMHPWAGKVRYARCGGEAMAVAVRIARACTGRDKIVFCGYHGWMDWYLAANLGETDALNGHLIPGLEPAGVPRGLRGTAFPFKYNSLEDLKRVMDLHKGEIAAIAMEPVRNFEPMTGFLAGVREVASREGAVMLLDEITSGWRKCDGGVHLTYGIQPDIAVFAKGMSNGFPMAAIVGRPEVMEAAQKSFISSTNWTERIGPVAALATIGKCRENKVSRRLNEVGERVQAGWKKAADSQGLSIAVSGIPALGHFVFQYDNGQAIKTLFVQKMLEKGFLATNALYVMFAHKDEHIQTYLEAVEESFAEIAKTLKEGLVEKSLKGPVAHTGFRRLT
jgi:glutamate-1-semialdehyde 2,1-aminomutase